MVDNTQVLAALRKLVNAHKCWPDKPWREAKALLDQIDGEDKAWQKVGEVEVGEPDS